MEISQMVIVDSYEQLTKALEDQTIKLIKVSGTILCPNEIELRDGVALIGESMDESGLAFNSGEGIAITSNNTIKDLSVTCSPNERAIFLAEDKEDLGVFKLQNITTVGQIQFLTRSNTLRSKLIASHIDIVACDARNRVEQPQKYGVTVYQGAFTVYNFNGNSDSEIIVHLTDISLGRKDAPVLGSGLFVSGFGDEGGWVKGDLISTKNIYSNGMIPFGQPNKITAGVFIVYGAEIVELKNKGEVVTYGVNDMVLDTWGTVTNWVAEKQIVSHGPSGIGFVNFGHVDKFWAKDKIITHGLGARGFNQYDGTVNHAKFNSIETYGDGAIGIQISKPVGDIEIEEDIVTHGSIGNTLVKGVIMSLPADAISVKPGGSVASLVVGGNIIARGDQVTAYHIEGGEVKSLSIHGTVMATGKESVKVAISEGGKSPDNI